MGASKQLWGWDKDNEIWRPLKVDSSGRITLDSTLLFEEPPTDGETSKGVTSNWIYDHWKDPDVHHDQLHAESHQDGNPDEISVAGLSGELADRQPSKVGNSTLGWTANKLLKGAGAGNAPTEIDVPSGGYTQGARVYHSAEQIIATTTDVILAFDSERYDTDTIHDNVTNNSRLTCKTAGKYTVSVALGWYFNVTGIRIARIKFNGTTYFAALQYDASPNASMWMAFSTILELAVNDYVEVEVRQTSGGNLNIYAINSLSSEFMMQRIG